MHQIRFGEAPDEDSRYQLGLLYEPWTPKESNRVEIDVSLLTGPQTLVVDPRELLTLLYNGTKSRLI